MGVFIPVRQAGGEDYPSLHTDYGTAGYCCTDLMGGPTHAWKIIATRQGVAEIFFFHWLFRQCFAVHLDQLGRDSYPKRSRRGTNGNYAY